LQAVRFPIKFLTLIKDKIMIIFQNEGLIDIDAVTTLGVSVKNDNAIGYFGTGVKFAIATILRNRGKVKMFRGLVPYEFASQETEIRGKKFNLVTMNGTNLGFTTDLGRNWEPWMAFRELASNALDEGGSYLESDAIPIGANKTVFVVICAGITEAYYLRREIILESKPIYKNEHLEIHDGGTRYIYYRGVRVGNFHSDAKFTYNILRKIDLTEDRTYKYHFQLTETIAEGLATCTDTDIIHTALNAGSKFVEHDLQFPSYKHSPQFLSEALALRADLSNVINANPSAMKLAHDRSLCSLGPAQSVALTSVQSAQLQRALAMLKQGGYDVDYPIVIVQSLGEGVLGLAKEDKIFLSLSPFEKGTKEIASTILEEYVHLKTGYGDETRQLQTWLFDQVLVQIEEKLNQPF
jgi:hypothetical protein